MPNIAAVLKEEIVRLARKEVRRQMEKLRRGTLQHRKSIANLNRAVRLGPGWSDLKNLEVEDGRAVREICGYWSCAVVHRSA